MLKSEIPQPHLGYKSKLVVDVNLATMIKINESKIPTDLLKGYYFKKKICDKTSGMLQIGFFGYVVYLMSSMPKKWFKLTSNFSAGRLKVLFLAFSPLAI